MLLYGSTSVQGYQSCLKALTVRMILRTEVPPYRCKRSLHDRPTTCYNTVRVTEHRCSELVKGITLFDSGPGPGPGPILEEPHTLLFCRCSNDQKWELGPPSNCTEHCAQSMYSFDDRSNGANSANRSVSQFRLYVLNATQFIDSNGHRPDRQRLYRRADGSTPTGTKSLFRRRRPCRCRRPLPLRRRVC